MGKTPKQRDGGGIKYIFGCFGHPRFLINLGGKWSNPAFESVVKDALGGYVDVSGMRTQTRGEKFRPGKTSNTSLNRTEAMREKPRATIEREAALCFRDTAGKALLLAADGECQLYSFDPEANPGLTPTNNHNESDGSSESGDSDEVSVGCEVEARESATAASGHSQVRQVNS